ncbi:MAG: exodeoxyribonuclease VII small subunit [Bryobacter sp.]|nr:exodeoxyribonuclease VII small subunit [Bryobacter sp.]
MPEKTQPASASPASTSPASESPSKTIEAELLELQQIVAQLEESREDLEVSLSLYERGVSLSESIKKRISEVETRIELIARKGQSSS